jgi:hypothetical protein
LRFVLRKLRKFPESGKTRIGTESGKASKQINQWISHKKSELKHGNNQKYEEVNHLIDKIIGLLKHSNV